MLMVLSVGCFAGSFLGQPPQQRKLAKEEQAAPDLEAYRRIVERVRAGESYYDAAGDVLSGMGFRTGSLFNWRLPTYAWVFSRLPNMAWVQGVLAILGLAGMMLAFGGERRELAPGLAFVTVLLLIGVCKWIFDGQAYLAQEVWAAVLLLLSAAAYGVDRRVLAVAAGLAALFFRELAMPYCVVALAIALWRRRWWESLTWTVGIVLFGLFLYWHASQVRLQPAAMASNQGAISDWITFSGLPFILATVRMNGFLLPLPPPFQAIYLCLALIGLIGWASDRGLLLTLAVIAYLAAFAMLGLPNHLNMYWGLLTAPLLCFGPARAPRAIADLLHAAR